MYQDILDKLIADTSFRERQNRMLTIAEMLIEKYHINAEPSRVKAIIEDANSMDRYWRLILGERKDLQGTDYDTKRIVEEQKEIELGYSPNYERNIRTLKLL
jgi:hypothetical protein